MPPPRQPHQHKRSRRETSPSHNDRQPRTRRRLHEDENDSPAGFDDEETPTDRRLAAEDEGLLEEEPEGEDLFGEDYLRDYQASATGNSSSSNDSIVHDDVMSIEKGKESSDDDMNNDMVGDGFIVPDDEAEEEERAGELLTFPQRMALEQVLEERQRQARDQGEKKDEETEEEVEKNDENEHREQGKYDIDDYDMERDKKSGRRHYHNKSMTSEDEDASNGGDVIHRFQGIDLPTGGAVSRFAMDDPIYLNEHLAADAGFDWTKPQGSLQDWLVQEIPRRIVKNRAFYFFSTYVRSEEEDGSPLDSRAEENPSKTQFTTQQTTQKLRFAYREAIHNMVQNNEQSFELLYWDLGAVYNSVLAVWLAEIPEILIDLLEEVANYYVYRILYPHYYKVYKRIYVRLVSLPVCDPIRDFRQIHMNVIVRVEGVVIRRSAINPQLLSVKYDCARCSYTIGPIIQNGDREVKVSLCPSCHSKGPFTINLMQTEFRNHQTIVLQEPPGKVPPGRLPRSLEVVLMNDLIDRAKPGETVEVVGVYKNSFDPLLNTKQGFPVFTTTLIANNISRRGVEGRDTYGVVRSLPQSDRDRITQLSRHPNIKRKLLQSIAPSIHGREDIKLGILLCLLGGVAKDVGGDQSHRIRGDINVLLVGDPGCAKSQFLKYVEITADRAVFTTGRGSTAVGLTASVHKDGLTGDFTLEGGALVIADKGVCCIDEFDKMSDQDRTSIHEAMEQQTISIARGGIVTTLSARCSIIAAANPIGGRYDPSVSFDINVNLTPPILSRFDLLFVVRDEINPELDAKLASFICSSHYKNHPTTREEAQQRTQERHMMLSELRNAYKVASTSEEQQQTLDQIDALRAAEKENSDETMVEDLDPNSLNPLPQSVLRQYIQYARSQCIPRIVNIDENVMTRVYTNLRQQSRMGGVAITVRHMESLIRLSEAHAKLYLREYVKDEDVTATIAFFLRCFLQTQKYSARTALNKYFRRYLDADKEPLHLLHFKLKALIAQTRQYERQISGNIDPVTTEVDLSELEAIADQLNISRGALTSYLESPVFKQEFGLERNDRGEPLTITHTFLPVV